MLAQAFATEVARTQSPRGDYSAFEINKNEAPICVRMALTVDNNFNLFIGNKLRITQFITSGDNYQIQTVLNDLKIFRGQYLYVMAWNN